MTRRYWSGARTSVTSDDLRCRNVSYSSDLPQISIIFIFVNEALSVLLRSVHTAIQRTPSHLLKEIILVDDHSSSCKNAFTYFICVIEIYSVDLHSDLNSNVQGFSFFFATKHLKYTDFSDFLLKTQRFITLTFCKLICSRHVSISICCSLLCDNDACNKCSLFVVVDVSVTKLESQLMILPSLHVM